MEPEVQQYALSQHISTNEAVLKLIQAGLQQIQAAEGRNYITEGIGLFKNPEDTALLDAAVAIAKAERRRPSTQKLA